MSLLNVKEVSCRVYYNDGLKIDVPDEIFGGSFVGVSVDDACVEAGKSYLFEVHICSGGPPCICNGYYAFVSNVIMEL